MRGPSATEKFDWSGLLATPVSLAEECAHFGIKGSAGDGSANKLEPDNCTGGRPLGAVADSLILFSKRAVTRPFS